MSKSTIYYRNNKQSLFEFSAEEINSDGSVVLLEKIEREHGIVKYYSNLLTDNRKQSSVKHSFYKMLK